MTRHSLKRTGAVFLLLTFAVTAAIVPQFARPHVTAAQTAQPTTPLNVCGTLGQPSASTVTFTTNSVTLQYNIAASSTFIVPQAQLTQDVCFTGQIDAQGAIVSGSLTPDYASPVLVCGIVHVYNPPTQSAVGFLSIGSSSLPVGDNAPFTGASIAVNTDICISGSVNGLGQLTTGAVSADSGSSAQTTLVTACGALSNYSPPSATANGSFTITTPNAVLPFTIVANSTVNPSGFAGTSGSNVCLVGASNPAGQLTRATFSANTASNTPTVDVCGAVTQYQPATATQIGNVLITGVNVSLAVSTVLTGVPVIVPSNICIQGTFNGLGQLATGTAGANPNAPTATPTVTLTPTATATATATGTAVPATATATATNTPVPASTATATPTATSTPVPTATATATSTATSTPVPPIATPTPRPARKYRAAFSYLSVWYHFIRVGTQETIVVQAKKHTQHGIWLTVRFPSGRYYAYYTNTDKSGFWSTRFTVPRNGLSKFTSEAVVTAQLWYRNTTTKSYATFFLV